MPCCCVSARASARTSGPCSTSGASIRRTRPASRQRSPREGLQPPSKSIDTSFTTSRSCPPTTPLSAPSPTSWWGKQPSINGYWEEREHSRQWDTTPLYGEGDQQRTEATNPGEIYNENSAADITARVQELLDLYFPAGITPDPMGFANAPPAIDAITIGMTATSASAPWDLSNTTLKTPPREPHAVGSPAPPG